MNRIIEAVEPILTPLIFASVTAMGSWGVWVSVGTLDAKSHVKEYETVVKDLRVVVTDLQEVKVDLAAQSVLTDSMLSQILEEVRD